MRYILASAAVSLLLASGASGQAFQNGGFETGSYNGLYGNNSLGNNSTAISGWTVHTVDASANVDWDRNDNQYGLLPSQGNFSLDLTGTTDKDGNYIEQTFDTVIGHTYSLSFDVGANEHYGRAAGSTVSALIDGLGIYSFTNTDYSSEGPGYAQSWKTGSTTFLATGAQTKLALAEGTGAIYVGLDNVKVADLTPDAPSTGAVPEPATWAMMLVGFGVVGAAARRRKVSTTVTYA